MLPLDADTSGSMQGPEPSCKQFQWRFEHIFIDPIPLELSEEEKTIIREALVLKPLPEWIKQRAKEIKRERTS